MSDSSENKSWTNEIIIGVIASLISAAIIGVFSLGFQGGQGVPPPASTLDSPLDDNLTPSGSERVQSKNLSQVQIQFHKDQRLHQEMELFVDGNVQQAFNPYNQQVLLQLAEGSHAIKVLWRGEQVWVDEVRVKPPDQGVTLVKVPELDDPAAPGTLVLKFVGPDAHYRQRVDLFIDGRVKDGYYGYRQHELQLLPGEHTVVLKKFGIELLSTKVDVKKPRDGKTFLEINLVTTGTVRIQNAPRIGPGVQAYVKIDKDTSGAKPWPSGTDCIEVHADVGTRLIEVYTTRPVNQVIHSFTVKVEPGKQMVVDMKQSAEKPPVSPPLKPPLPTESPEEKRERLARYKLKIARELLDGGMSSDRQKAMDALDDLFRQYPGTQAAQEGETLLKAIRPK